MTVTCELGHWRILRSWSDGSEAVLVPVSWKALTAIDYERMPTQRPP